MRVSLEFIERAFRVGRRSEVGATARTVLDGVVQVVEGVDDVIGGDVRETEGPDARRVDDPTPRQAVTG